MSFNDFYQMGGSTQVEYWHLLSEIARFGKEKAIERWKKAKADGNLVTTSLGMRGF